MATTLESASAARERRPRPLRAGCPGQLAGVRRDAWDRLVTSGSTPLRYGYLTAWEKSKLRGLASRPIIAHTGNPMHPVAACPGYFYDLDLPTVRTPQLAGAVDVIRRLCPGFMLVRTYELGTPTPLTNPFLVADPAERRQLVPAVIDAALEEGARGGASFLLVQNFTSRRTPAGEKLASRGFVCVPIPSSAVLDLPYSTFDEYLGAMRAQYRRRAQQTLKRSRELRVEQLNDFAHLADELAQLWRAIYVRAREVRREVLTPAFFRAISELEEASVLLLRRCDESIASFALLLGDGPWLSFLQCGFEAEARREGAYFRLLYEIVRFAIEGGFEQVDLGITTLTPKLDVGAVPVPLFAWIKYCNPLIQRATRVAARAMHAPDLAPRNVFKEAPPTPGELVTRRGLPV